MTAEEYNRLGMSYYYGDDGEINLLRSAYYYEMAAKAGCVDAMLSTGINYCIGCGVPQNMEQGLYWLNKAADNGLLTAIEYLGRLYYEGDGVSKDYYKSLKYFETGIYRGCPYSMALAARQFEKGEGTNIDKERAKALYMKAYEQIYHRAIEDDHIAQLWIGRWFLEGCSLIGVKQDFYQSANWFKKSANDGITDAQNMLGICYEYGIGVIQDCEEAVRLYKLAAQKQEPVALCNLGRMYYEGKGIERNEKIAAGYFCQAANLGFADAQASIGYCYLTGKGVAKDEIKAVLWFRKACENENESAYENLADCYLKGLGVIKDEKEAFKLYYKSAELGSLNSRVCVAECYIEGKGATKDFKKAVDILCSICDEIQGFEHHSIMAVVEHNAIYNPFDKNFLNHYAKAYYLLATLKYTGKGTDKDVNEAICLLRLAYKYGYTDDNHSDISNGTLLETIQNGINDNLLYDTFKSWIEVRDLGSWQKGQMCRYAITIHHADDSTSDIRFKTQRNKLVYLLSLMFAYNKQSAGVMARYFAYDRELLQRLVQDASFDVHDVGTWIDEFVYKEVYVADIKKYQYEYCNTRYSIAVSQSNEYLRESCKNNEEYEMFRLRTSGGRESMASIALSPKQIILPSSLAKLAEKLPTKETLTNYVRPIVRPIDYDEYLSHKRDKRKIMQESLYV